MKTVTVNLAGIAVLSAALLGACRGDDPIIESAPTQPGSGASSSSGASSGGDDHGTTSRSGASSGNASSSGMASSSSSASSSSASSSGDVEADCYPDADGDGYPGIGTTVKATRGVCPGRTTLKAGPLDCDDAEPNAFPGQTIYFDHPTARGSWDYDCDAKTTMGFYDVIGKYVTPRDMCRPISDTEEYCRQFSWSSCRGHTVPVGTYLDPMPAANDCGHTNIKAVFGNCWPDDPTSTCHGIKDDGATALVTSVCR